LGETGNFSAANRESGKAAFYPGSSEVGVAPIEIQIKTLHDVFNARLQA
jgi:hypothetical protein